MNKILRLLTIGLSAAFVSLSAFAAQLAPGAYSVGAVQGDVTYKVAGGTDYVALTVGLSLPQGATIKTGAASTARLVFSNGATASVLANSVVEITKFEQEAFSGAVTVDAEPSISNTEIKVIDGQVVSKVAKLKKGSKFLVKTPVGAAGVRGTTFSVSYNRTTGRLIINTFEGSVVPQNVSGLSQGATPEAAQEITAGEQVVFNFEVNETTGAVSIPTVAVNTLPPEVVAAVMTFAVGATLPNAAQILDTTLEVVSKPTNELPAEIVNPTPAPVVNETIPTQQETTINTIDTTISPNS